MDKSFIQEAFKQVYLTEDAEEFSLNVSGPDDTESFMDIVNSDEYADDEMISDVYDLEAEAKEDLKQSYIGKVILDCNVCHSNVFFNKDEITENEDGICCEEIECPYCMSNEGYTIIGEVKPYQEEDEVDIEDIESAEVPDEEPEEEIKVEETEDEENLHESIEGVYGYANKLVKGKKVSVNGKKGKITDVTGVSGADESDPKALSIKNIDSVEVTFDDGELEDIDVEDLDSPLKEGLKADEVKELRGDEEINGADGPISAVDELEGSDEIRGPKYKELNEENGSSKKYVVITKGGLGRDADSLNGRLFDSKEEAAEACKKWKNSYNKKDKKTLKPETSIYTYKPGGPFDDAVKANKKNKGLNECGDPDTMEEGILGTVGGGIAGAAIGGKFGHPVLGAVGGALAGNAIQNSLEDKNESLEECGDPQLIKEGALGAAAGAIAGAALTRSPAGARIGATVGNKLGNVAGEIFDGNDTEEESLTEAIEDATITTSDEIVTMSTKEDGGVVVETSPKEEFDDESVEEFTGDEMIAPLEPETESDVEDAIEVNSTDEEELPEDELLDEMPEDEFSEEGESPEDEFEEFDEESFNGLGESYLKRCYENVTSFKTSNITLNENKEFVIEGKIGFDSGNKKDTQFVFSTKSNENGKLKLEGYNKQISKGKKTFKLNCSINNKALICESLNYNYKGKNDLNESVRVYGTVKRK